MSTLQRIDDTLAYYSTGLNTQVVTPVEKPSPEDALLDVARWFDVPVNLLRAVYPRSRAAMWRRKAARRG